MLLRVNNIFNDLRRLPSVVPPPPLQSNSSLSSSQPADHKLRREIQREGGNFGRILVRSCEEDGIRSSRSRFLQLPKNHNPSKAGTTLAWHGSCPLVERCQSLGTFFAHLVYSANPFVPDARSETEEAIKPRRPLFVPSNGGRLASPHPLCRSSVGSPFAFSLLPRSCMSRHLPRGF